MRRLLSILALVLLPAVAQATVTVTSVGGTLAYGALMNIGGAGFGSKPNQEKTYCFANFEDLSAGVSCSSWSVAGVMVDVQNVTLKTTNCEEGGGCVGPINDLGTNKNNTASVGISDVGNGGKIQWSWDWNWTGGAGTYPANNINWKTYRAWPNTIGLKNDFYGGQQSDGSFNNATENSEGIAITGLDRQFTPAIRPPIGSWQQIVMQNQLNSDGATSQTDGIWKATVDGSSRINLGTWRSNTAADVSAGRYRKFYPVHMVMANNNFPAGGDFRFDNILVDTSYCAVWVSTVATNVATAKKWWLVVQTWNAGGNGITAVYAQKAFTNGTHVYLYVQANDLTVNASGFPLTVSGTTSGGGGGGGTGGEVPPTDAGYCPCLP